MQQAVAVQKPQVQYAVPFGPLLSSKKQFETNLKRYPLPMAKTSQTKYF